MGLNIRLATEEDIPFLVHARLEFFEALWNKPITEEVRQNGLASLPGQLKTMLANNLYCFLVEKNTQIVSVAFLYVVQYLFHPKLPTGTFGRIANVYTPSTHRGNGYARAALECIIQFARENKFDALTLEASDAGRPLYEALGFVTDNLDQHLPMTLKL